MSWHKEQYLAFAREHWIALSIAAAVVVGFAIGKVL